MVQIRAKSSASKSEVIKKQMIERVKLYKRKNTTIDGEDLPDEITRIPEWVFFFSLISSTVLFLLLNYLFSAVYLYIPLIFQRLRGLISNDRYLSLYDQITPMKIWNAFKFRMPIPAYVVILLISAGIGFFLYKKLSFRFKKIAIGQKGDNRLTTIEEIKKQYKEIPDRSETYKGRGGFPITHYKGKYYIDTNTVNNRIIGISRVGKDEMYVIPNLDILSRAEIKDSLIINDIKGEEFAASYDPMKKRGYLNLVLNLIDPLQGMSYQLLHLVITYWKLQDYDTVQLLVNSITFGLYHDPKASGTTKHFNDTAQGVVNAIILALLEKQSEKNELHKVTMYNSFQFVIEMGNYKWINPETMQEKNALDEYFRQLPQGSLAKAQYASTSFAGDRERGSILSTVIKGLRIFQFEKVAKMTSTNSFDLKRLGFPKDIEMVFSKELRNLRIKVKFMRGKRLIGMETVKPSQHGISVLNFNYDLKTGDILKVIYQDKKRTVFENCYSIDLSKLGEDFQAKLEKISGNFDDLLSIKMTYLDKPIAVFMIIPDADKSLHPISSIFVSQVYQELVKNCTITRGGSCHRWVGHKLNEFGQMPVISNLDNIVTACLGRNIYFDLYVQSNNQFYKYGKEEGKTIKENCQNTIYLMSKDESTIKDIQKDVGNKTIAASNSSEKAMSLDNSSTKSPEGEFLLTYERLGSLLEGESVVIRTLHRKDLEGNRVRPYPIFNTKETVMPYRHTFLADEFDTKKDWINFDIDSKHRDLDLNDYAIDFNTYIEEIFTFDTSDEEVELIEEEPIIIDQVFKSFSVALEDRERILKKLSESASQAIVEVKKTIHDSEAAEKLIEFIKDNHT